MIKIYQLTCCIAFLIILQSCFVKQRSNMSFLDRSVMGREAEVMSIKVPMFLIKPFLTKALKEEDDEVLHLAIKKIKSVKLTTLSNTKNNNQIRENFINFLKNKDMEEYATIISDGDRVSVNGLMKKDKIKTLMLGVSSDDGEHVFIEVKGNFTMDDLAHAINSYEKK